MKVLLTGGTGFIGSHVAVALAKDGHRVTILARNRNKVPALTSIDGLEVLQGDLGDLRRLAPSPARRSRWSRTTARSSSGPASH